MRVLIFSTAYFPYVGGAEVAVKEITSRISEVSFDMITVRLDIKDVPQEKIGNVTVYRIGRGLGRFDKLLFPFRAARLAGRLHQKNHYDVAWSIMASFSGFAALFFKKKNRGVKFLLTLQEGDDLKQIERKVWPVKFWFKEIFCRADYIQCISSYLAKWAREMKATCPVEVVPNGVNKISDFRFQISDLRKQLGVIEDDKIILTTSRLVKKNGIMDLIEAVALLNTRYKIQNTLVICGDGEEREKLEVRSKKLGIEKKVKFMGFVPPAELPKFYAAADVFCRPSLSEGLGNSFLEAMAYGVPVVATPSGGIPDFLKDNETGWFCQVNNPASIAEKIKYILDDVETRHASSVLPVVTAAKQMVLEKYNWDKISEQMKHSFNPESNATTLARSAKSVTLDSYEKLYQIK
ncbi:MAG: glycosyltransferase family 4 protein [Patescibacteria group bacterium]|jgi:glycosyltransferase involved in cell wall biosynthesis